MDPMDYPDYEPTYAELGIDPNNPNYSSDDDGESFATGSDYAETEPDQDEDYYDTDHLEEGPLALSNQVC